MKFLTSPRAYLGLLLLYGALCVVELLVTRAKEALEEQLWGEPDDEDEEPEPEPEEPQAPARRRRRP